MQKFLSVFRLSSLLPKPYLNRHPFRSFSTLRNKSDDGEEIEFSADEEEIELEQTSDDAMKGEFITAAQMENFEERPFTDKIKLKIIGGKGGDGAFCFYRDRIVRTGAPDGGDGGDGGSFCFKAVPDVTDLRHFKKPILQGNKGGNGRRLKKDGKVGLDLHYPVPIGTLVWELKLIQKRLDRNARARLTKQEYSTRYTAVKKKLLADLATEGASVMVAMGGKGGRGNALHRGLQAAEKGKPGEEIDIMLELKSIADIGLVGYPNAGKSSIVASMTRAFPKIASYPFTTLQPTIGKIEFIDDFMMTMADIPGLIEGSHQNKGLGHEFLRHIERTKVLMFVLDINEKDLVGEYNTLKRELELYQTNIFKGKPSIVVLNKVDLVENSEHVVSELRERLGVEVIGMSAKHSVGLDKVVVRLREIIEEVRKKEAEIEH